MKNEDGGWRIENIAALATISSLTESIGHPPLKKA
jgi:hypothetical protein